MTNRLTRMQLLLLVEERSCGLYPGFAAAMRDTLKRDLVYVSPHYTGTVQAPNHLALTTKGKKAIADAGCTRKVGSITCAKHGLKAYWPCRGEATRATR